MKSILLLSLLFILTGCFSKNNPEFSSLGNINHPNNNYPTWVPEATISVSLEVTGLTSGSIKLKNGSAETLISNNGYHQFPHMLRSGDHYNFELSDVPSNQNCVLKNHIGTARNNITDLTIQCTISSSYYISGSVSGLEGDLHLALKDNSTLVSSSTVNAGKGNFTFPYSMATGRNYEVLINSMPALQTCTISNNTGIVSGKNINNLKIVCSQNLSLKYDVGLEIDSSTSGSVTIMTSALSGNEQTYSLMSGSTISPVLSGFIRGRRHILEIKSSSPDVYCYFDSTKSFKYHGAMSHTNVSSVKVKCKFRSPCSAISGEVLTPFAPVKDILCENDKLYLATTSPHIGKNFGSGWSFPISNNTPTPPKTFDRITGYVSIAVPDESGGWYIAGSFNQIGDKVVSGIAHLFNDMTLDESFNIQTDGSVEALFLKDQILYIGGSVRRLSSVSEGITTWFPINTNGLAAIDLSLKPFKPTSLSLHLNDSYNLSAIHATDKEIILTANSYGSDSNNFKIASIPKSSGVVTSSQINVLMYSGGSDFISKVYVYKNFVYYLANNSIYKKSLHDSSSSFVTTNVSQMAGYNNKLYFSTTNGINELNLDTNINNTLVSTSHNYIYGMDVNNEILCATIQEGNAITIGSIIRNSIFCVDLNTKTITALNAPDYSLQQIFMSSTNIFVPTYMGKKIPTNQSFLFKIDLATNSVDNDFNTSAMFNHASSLALDATGLYVAGYYSYDSCLRRIDPLTGETDSNYTPNFIQQCNNTYSGYSPKIKSHNGQILYANSTEYKMIDSSGNVVFQDTAAAPIYDLITQDDSFVLSTLNGLFSKDYSNNHLMDAPNALDMVLAPLPDNKFLTVGANFPSSITQHFDHNLDLLSIFTNANFEFAFSDGNFLLTQSPGGTVMKRDGTDGTIMPLTYSLRLENINSSQGKYINGSLFLYGNVNNYSSAINHFKIIGID